MFGWFHVENIVDWLRDFGIWAVLISLLLNVIISILGVVPSIFLSGANAVVFGIIPGFLISLAGEVLGAGISFRLYRWGFGKTYLDRSESWAWLQRINHASRKRRMVLLLTARITPFLPSGIITFAAAISRMPFMDFMLVTVLGKAPSIILETFVGHDLILINENFPRLIITLVCILLIYTLFRWLPRPIEEEK